MLSIIIVDYKSIEKTIDYIFHLIGKIKIDEMLNFIIVDNDESTHHTYLSQRLGCSEILFANNQRIYCYKIGKNIVGYYNTGNNLGYAKGNNCGCAIAKELFGSAYYLISNNDLELPYELDWELIKTLFASNPSIGIIGPKVIGIDGKPQSPHKKPTAFGLLFLNYWCMATRNKIMKYSDLDYDNCCKFCYRVMGCFLFINAELFWNCGGFDEGTFLFSEELILAEKFLQNNYLTYFYNDYYVIHRHGETLRNTTKGIEGIKWSYESARYYFEKYRKCSSLFLRICDVNFELFCWLYDKTH